MAKKIHALILMALLFMLVGCESVEGLDPERDYKEAKINGFLMMIPRYFKRNAALDPQATLSYSHENDERVFHLVLVEKDKADAKNRCQRKGYLDQGGSLAHAFYRMHADEMAEQAEMEEMVAPRDTAVHELIQTRGEMMEDMPFTSPDHHYFLTIIEGVEKLYVVTIWTSRTKKNYYRETTQFMLNSFRLVP